MSKRATQIITVFEDGSIHIQELHKAITTDIPEASANDEEVPGDGDGNNPNPRPKDP